MYNFKYSLLILSFDTCVFSVLTLFVLEKGWTTTKKLYNAKINRTNPRTPQPNTRYYEQLRNAESGKK